MAEKTFRDAERKQLSMLAGSRNETLIWLAQRMPAWVNSDHLTLLGFIAMFAAGLRYWAASWDQRGAAGRHRGAGGELVRRQPGRHAGAGPQPAAAALRLLCRPHHRRDRDVLPDGRPGAVELYERRLLRWAC